MTPRRAAASLLALFRKQRLDMDLNEEIETHLEMAEQDGVAAGMSPAEARRAARRRFGGVEQIKEAHRDARGFQWVENFLRDFRYGLARLRREPGFTALIVTVLALGIGATVAMFSLLDAVLLKPLPFPEPDRIVKVWEAPRPGATNNTSTLDFLDWKRLSTVFEALSAEETTSAALTGTGQPVRLAGKLVTAEYFKVYGTHAQMGRTFTRDEDQAGAAPVVVISNGLWQSQFGADPNILDRELILDGRSHRVVGVLSPGVFDRDRAQFWKPLVFTPKWQTRDWHWLTVYGRLRPGATPEQAREQMRGIDAALEEVTPAFKRPWKIEVSPLESLVSGDRLRRSILVAFGAVGFVLLIACANVANLLLARGAARRKELAIRASLGASRGRLVTQLFSESLSLCLLGGALGILLASFLLHAIIPFLPGSVPYTAEIVLDLRALAFAAAAVLSVAVLVGILPSLQTTFGNLWHALSQSGRGSSGPQARVRRIIVIMEVALSLILVCGALLLFRSLHNLQQLETGITAESVITMSADLPELTYPTSERAALFYNAVIEQIRTVPGVVDAGLSTFLPLQWISGGEGVKVPGLEELINVRFKRVDAGYFRTLQIPLRTGRGINSQDRSGTPRVVVINEALAARLSQVAGMTEPVGQSVRLTDPRYPPGGEFRASNAQIVGIIRNERVASPGVPEPPVAYVPLAQAPHPGIKFIVRAQGNPASVVPGIREAVRQVDPNLPLADIATLEDIREETFSGTSRPAWVIGAFAVLAAFLAALGLHGVLAYAVTQQRREIGIRMALGAQRRDVVSQVLRSAILTVAAGLGIGALGVLAVTRVLKSLLFEVSSLDPLAIAVACASMTLVGLVAGLLPASRAARVDPMVALREDG